MLLVVIGQWRVQKRKRNMLVFVTDNLRTSASTGGNVELDVPHRNPRGQMDRCFGSPSWRGCAPGSPKMTRRWSPGMTTETEKRPLHDQRNSLPDAGVADAARAGPSRGTGIGATTTSAN